MLSYMLFLYVYIVCIENELAKRASKLQVYYICIINYTTINLSPLHIPLNFLRD